jgi:hypothetical protein
VAPDRDAFEDGRSRWSGSRKCRLGAAEASIDRLRSPVAPARPMAGLGSSSPAIATGQEGKRPNPLLSPHMALTLLAVRV